jgi:predicted acyl esterase
MAIGQSAKVELLHLTLKRPRETRSPAAVESWCMDDHRARNCCRARHMGARSFQTMVPMRDGTRLNTFVFLPESGRPRFPVILHRTPYGIVAADARDKFDHTKAWLPSAAEPMRGSILRAGFAPTR